MALQAQAGRQDLILMSPGCQGDRGVREVRMGMPGSDNWVSVM